VPIEIMDGPSKTSATGAQLFDVQQGDEHFRGVTGVTKDPAVWGGRAVIRRTRIPVFVLVDQFNHSKTVEGVVEAYPELKRADVHFALTYAELDREGIDRDRETYLAEVPPEARSG